ncbi:MAG: 50S ribosomal protein L4 [Mycoplasmoidaceae bacterium]|nr:50S ribosomal protein L4 [Mycoplasmoidaceae bacterium]
MSKLNLLKIDGSVSKEISFDLPKSTKVFNQAMFDQVLAENAGCRQGTHSTLTKAEVRGGGKKPLQQKHSGNARQGSIRNPH